jgi:hypothetical protein
MISYRRAAPGLPELPAFTEQHESGAEITGIRMPPGRDEGIQAAACCHLAVDTPATAAVRYLHAHNRMTCVPVPGSRLQISHRAQSAICLAEGAQAR